MTYTHVNLFKYFFGIQTSVFTQKYQFWCKLGIHIVTPECFHSSRIRRTHANNWLRYYHHELLYDRKQVIQIWLIHPFFGCVRKIGGVSKTFPSLTKIAKNCEGLLSSMLKRLIVKTALYKMATIRTFRETSFLICVNYFTISGTKWHLVFNKK